MSSEGLDRRSFLRAAGATAAASALPAGSAVAGAGTQEAADAPEAAGGPRVIHRAVKYGMIAGDGTPQDKLALLRDLGYAGVEPGVGLDEATRTALRKASEATGVRVHGVVNAARADLEGAVDEARYYGADSVLVVAGRVDANNAYDQVYADRLAWIRRAVPYAERHGVRLLVENVWNNVLLSPLEMARFIDACDSPMVGVYFDVGNVVRFGWPEQWIRVLNRRIHKLDVKEYSRRKQLDEGLWKGFEVELGEGDCNWPEVVRALDEIGFSGWATAEVGGGGRERLADIARRMDAILAPAG